MSPQCVGEAEIGGGNELVILTRSADVLSICRLNDTSSVKFIRFPRKELWLIFRGQKHHFSERYWLQTLLWVLLHRICINYIFIKTFTEMLWHQWTDCFSLRDQSHQDRNAAPWDTFYSLFLYLFWNIKILMEEVRDYDRGNGSLSSELTITPETWQGVV